MNSEIVIALISLLGTLAGSLGGIVVSSKLTSHRLEQLEKKVDKHNNFATRMPLLEQDQKEMKEDIKEIKRTIQALHNDRTVVNMFKNIAKLIDVKSIVTLALTAVFSALSISGRLSPDQFQTVFTTVIAFYFGTQASKEKTTTTKEDK